MGWACCCGKHSYGEPGLLGFPALATGEHTPSPRQPRGPISPHPGNTLSSTGRCEVTAWGRGGQGRKGAQIPLLPSNQVPHRAKGSPPPAPSSLDKGARQPPLFLGCKPSQMRSNPPAGLDLLAALALEPPKPSSPACPAGAFRAAGAGVRGCWPPQPHSSPT